MKLEEKLVHTFWKDGLLDCFAGFAISVIGISWLLDLVAVGACAGIIVTIWKPARDRLVVPRLGHVEFSDRRNRKSGRHLQLMLLGGVLTFLAGIGSFLMVDGAPGGMPWIAAMPVMLIAIPLAATAIGILSRRFLCYGAAGFMLAWVTLVQEWHPGTPILFLGLIVLVSGIWLQSKFLHATRVTGPDV